MNRIIVRISLNVTVALAVDKGKPYMYIQLACSVFESCFVSYWHSNCSYGIKAAFPVANSSSISFGHRIDLTVECRRPWYFWWLVQQFYLRGHNTTIPMITVAFHHVAAATLRISKANKVLLVLRYIFMLLLLRTFNFYQCFLEISIITNFLCLLHKCINYLPIFIYRDLKAILVLRDLLVSQVLRDSKVMLENQVMMVK